MSYLRHPDGGLSSVDIHFGRASGMYLVAIGWIYVAVMMSIAEVMHPDGTLLGGIVTFFLYGLVPTALVLYVMAAPLRRKARQAQEAKDDAVARVAGAAALAQDPASIEPNASGHAPRTTELGSITAVREPK